MKKIWKALLAGMMALMLAGCGSSEADQIKLLVTGNIDTIYLGKYDAEYMQLVDATEEELTQMYEDGLEAESEWFCTYFGILSEGEEYTDLDSGLRQQMVEMYKQIYSNTKYSVGDVNKLEDGSYTVQVTVSPINVMELALDAVDSGSDNPYTQFQEKYADTDFSQMTAEDYWAYTEEYAQACIDLVSDQIPNIGYDEDKSLSIQVQQGEDNLYEMNQDDWSRFDGYVITY